MEHRTAGLVARLASDPHYAIRLDCHGRRDPERSA
jgi:hypothetical protein